MFEFPVEVIAFHRVKENPYSWSALDKRNGVSMAGQKEKARARRLRVWDLSWKTIQEFNEKNNAMKFTMLLLSMQCVELLLC